MTATATKPRAGKPLSARGRRSHELACRAAELERAGRHEEAAAVRRDAAESMIPMFRAFARRLIASGRVPRGFQADDIVHDMVAQALVSLRLFDPDRGVSATAHAGRSAWLDATRRLKEYATAVRVPIYHHLYKPAHLKGDVPIVQSIHAAEDGWQIPAPGRDPADDAERRELLGRLPAALATLPRREQIVLTRRFGLGGADVRTLESIAPELGCSRSRVGQLEREALGRLRQRIERESGRHTPTGRRPRRPS